MIDYDFLDIFERFWMLWTFLYFFGHVWKFFDIFGHTLVCSWSGSKLGQFGLFFVQVVYPQNLKNIEFEEKIPTFSGKINW